MKAVITGGGGFLGSRLAAALRARDPKSDITLLDVAFPPGLESKFRCIAGDVASPDVIGRALDGDADSIFHLAAVVSGGAEADFDLGYHVNMDGTRNLLEAARRLKKPPRIVYTSSVAAFGGVMPQVLDDSTTPAPQTSYGTQKVIGEYLIADLTRKGFIDGRSLRLPTIVVRPGKPNLAASSFASGIIREPLAGVACECPVSDTGHSHATPASGSRMMPLANDEAARLGLPGRTTMVGKRRERPSMNPLRVRSAIRYSPITFCVP